MLKIEKLKVYDKLGNDLQWKPSSILTLKIESHGGKDYLIYPYIDVNNNIGGFYILDGGYGFGSYTIDDNGNMDIKHNIQNCYIMFNDTIISTVPIDNIVFGRISYTDSIGAHDSLYIKDISTDNIYVDTFLLNSNNITYPSLTYTCALFMDKVSTNLIETEHLHFFYMDNGTLSNIYDDEDSMLIAGLNDGDNELQLFEVDSQDNSIIWSKYIEHDIDKHIDNITPTPISFNIGFSSIDEGVYENTINIYHKLYNNYYIIAQIIINSESIGEDTRYRTLFSNFNIPDTKNYHDIFKESDNEEEYINWDLINNKSKELFVEYDNIFKFCGTYKGLINAVKFLGYDDIFFREWFLDAKTSTKKTYRVSYGNDDYNDSIKSIPYNDRKHLKKLNALSMVYNLNKETGEFDELGLPIVTNIYNSSIKSIRAKLISLKKWLETNIIGVNCRITDITAEGVYFESFDNRISSFSNTSFDIYESNEITPLVICDDILGDDYMFKLLNDYVPIQLTTKETTSNSDFIENNDISDFMWRAKVTTNSAILDNTIATSGFWVYDNTIKIVDLLNKTDNNIISDFRIHNSQKGKTDGNKINISLENAYIRTLDNNILYQIKPIVHILEDVEVDKIDFDIDSANVNIYKDTINKDILVYTLLDNSGKILHESNSYFNVTFGINSKLQYKYNIHNKGYCLHITNAILCDQYNNEIILSEELLIEIIDGNICIEPLNVNGDYKTTYINFNYDNNSKEQNINANFVYNSIRLNVKDNGNSLNYTLNVNHVGKYNIELLTWNHFNNMFINNMENNCYVYTDKPLIKLYKLSEDYEINSDIDKNNILDYPIYDAPLNYDITQIREINDEYSVIVESTSYMNKIPYVGSFVNIIDKTFGENNRKTYTVSEIENDVISNDGNTYSIFYINQYTDNIEYKIGDVINININIHQQGNRNISLFNSSCTSRILGIVYDNNLNRYELYVKNNIIPDYILHYASKLKDMCNIQIKPSWENVDNIDTFRISDSTEYNFNGNKLELNFKNDNYILPYIDSNFYISIEDFNVALVKCNWITKEDIENNNIVHLNSLYDISSTNKIILSPENIVDSNIYIWNVYTKDELVYRVYNNITAFNYEYDTTYNTYLESIDKYGNISSNKYEGLIKIKETLR